MNQQISPNMEEMILYSKPTKTILKKIHFGWIAPINYLNFIPEEETFHLVLAALLQNPTYREFYKKKAERGDTIIIDNMAFEEKASISQNKLIELVDNCGFAPTYVVAPDFPFVDYQKTLNSAWSFIDAVKDKPYKVMAVPQSVEGDMEGWLKCYNQFYKNPHIAVIGMSILGIPNAFCKMTGTKDIMFNRLFATQYLLNWGAEPGKKWHHYLGLGLPRELLLQRQLGLIDSCDSSSSIWHGINCIEYDNSYGSLKNGKTSIPVDFNYEMNVESTAFYQEQYIRKNIDYFKTQILG